MAGGGDAARLPDVAGEEVASEFEGGAQLGRRHLPPGRRIVGIGDGEEARQRQQPIGPAGAGDAPGGTPPSWG